MKIKTLLIGGEVYYQGQLQKLNLGINQGITVYLGEGEPEADEIISVSKQWVLPGLIDSQVHFREPGSTHKEDLYTGTLAALRGGITAILEMPNTNPSTVDEKSLNEKLSLAQGRCHVDYRFFIGATHENASSLINLEKLKGCCGIKIFMGSSTGSLLLDDDKDLDTIFSTTKGPIAVHCEDEERLVERKTIAESKKHPLAHPEWRDEDSAFKATQKIVELSKKYNKSVHILHISSKKEIEYLRENKTDKITVECTPQHLTLFAPDCYEKLGTLAQMNPPIRSIEHKKALLKALKEGVVDVIGSDHAPHTLEEKKRPYPQSPSGMPGVQTIVSLTLGLLEEGHINIHQFVNLLCFKPAEIYGLKDRGPIDLNQEANFTIVDPYKKGVFDDKDMASKSCWTPFHRRAFRGEAVMSFLRGEMIMKKGEMWGSMPIGQCLKRES